MRIDKGILICALFTLCFFYIWGIAIISVCLHAVNTNFAFKGTSEPVFSQIVNEWNTQPFVSIVAFKMDNQTSTYDCPVDYPDEVINETWQGQNIGCDCMRKTNAIKSTKSIT